MKFVFTSIFSAVLLSACDQAVVPKSNNHDEVVVETTDVDAFVEAFMGYCVLTMPRLEKVAAISKLKNWEPLSSDMLIAFGPAEADSDMNGWLLKGDFSPLFIATTKAVVGAEKHKNCTIMSQVSDTDALTQKITEIVSADAKPSLSDIESGQRHRIWNYKSLGDSFRLIIMDSPELAPGVITVSSNFVSN